MVLDALQVDVKELNFRGVSADSEAQGGDQFYRKMQGRHKARDELGNRNRSRNRNRKG